MLEREGGAFDVAGEVVEGAADADGDSYGGHFVKVACDPFLLSGGAVGDQENVGVGVVDDVLYFLFFVWGWRSGVCADDLNVWKSLFEFVFCLVGDTGLGSEEK